MLLAEEWWELHVQYHLGTDFTEEIENYSHMDGVKEVIKELDKEKRLERRIGKVPLVSSKGCKSERELV